MLWLKDDILIENSGISYTFKDAWNRTLSVVSANLTHTGQYTCQVRLRSGGFPTVMASATVTVLGECIVVMDVFVVVVVVVVIVVLAAATVVVVVVAVAALVVKMLCSGTSLSIGAPVGNLKEIRLPELFERKGWYIWVLL
jgi:hypothetical protein